MPPCASETCTRQSRWWRLAARGATLDGQWLCSQACIEEVIGARIHDVPAATAARRRGPVIRLGALLQHQGSVPPAQIAAALEAQAGSRLRLGEQLRSMGAVDPQVLLHALAEQAGVSYLASVDLARVQDGPGGLNLAAIQALRLVPIGPPEAGRIRVAFPAPVPGAALTIFRQQTGWLPEPYLVSDDDWLALLEHYGARSRGRLSAEQIAMTFARERDVHEAARRLAQVVMAAGDAQMRDARWGPYVWVRLQGAGAEFDLLLDQASDAVPEGVETWQAATTSR
jgi:hypothetical protein